MLGLSNQFQKICVNRRILYTKKVIRTGTKGMGLRYCQTAVFQAFCGAKKQSSFGPKLVFAEMLARQPQIVRRRWAEG
jgi:hypothetical protein